MFLLLLRLFGVVVVDCVVAGVVGFSFLLLARGDDVEVVVYGFAYLAFCFVIFSLCVV